MIKLDDVSFDYIVNDENGNEVSKKSAIKHLSLEIEDGSFVCIIGNNGSGKSTMARLMNGILSPNSGKVFVNGDDINIANRNMNNFVGMVFQNPDNQIVASVVEEDVAFGLENMSIPTEEIEKRVDYALKVVSMEEFRFSSPNKLSGGQKQRIAIAGVIAMKPKYIIFDESTSMLDPKGRKEIINTILKLNKEENITIILITHYMDEVLNADKIFVLSDGELKKEGTVREIFAYGSKLEEYNILLPFIPRLVSRINKDGYKLNKEILTIDELVECL